MRLLRQQRENSETVFSQKVYNARADIFTKSKVNREKLFVVLEIEPEVSCILSIWQKYACAQLYLQTRKKINCMKTGEYCVHGPMRDLHNNELQLSFNWYGI